jgi:hypothetical protein
MPDAEPMIKFNLSSNRGEKSFDSVSDFETWFGNEAIYWQRVRNFQMPGYNFFSPWETLETSVRRQLQTRNAQNATPAQRESAMTEISRLMTEAYASGTLFDSESPEGKLFSTYLNRDAHLGLGFLASRAPGFVLQSGWPASFFVGSVLGALYREGLLKEAQIDKDYLNSVEKEWHGRLESLVTGIKTERESNASELRTLVSETNSTLANIKTSSEVCEKKYSDSQVYLTGGDEPKVLGIETDISPDQDARQQNKQGQQGAEYEANQKFVSTPTPTPFQLSKESVEADLTRAWQSLTAEQRTQLTQEERNWVRRRDSLPAEERIKSTAERAKYIWSFVERTFDN